MLSQPQPQGQLEGEEALGRLRGVEQEQEEQVIGNSLVRGGNRGENPGDLPHNAIVQPPLSWRVEGVGVRLAARVFVVGQQGSQADLGQDALTAEGLNQNANNKAEHGQASGQSK